MPSSDVSRALLEVLCHGRPAYDVGYVGWGTPGLFSMLNSVADELLVRVYLGERPADARKFYHRTRLIGYGNVSLAAYWSPWTCGDTPPSAPVGSWAVPTLLAAPRYVVASNLLHLMYRPRNRERGASPVSATADRRYALAVHVRRGDKLAEQRNSEKIAMWDEAKVSAAVTAHVKGGGKGEGKGGGESSGESARPAVLLASDDNAFASRVASSLGPSVDIDRPSNEHDAGTTAPFDACDASCIPPLQALADGFGRADALLLSSKSNMGSFLMTWWGAANGDALPNVVDMDGKLHRGQMAKGKYFCCLAWGSRRGVCEANRTLTGTSSCHHSDPALARAGVN